MKKLIKTENFFLSIIILLFILYLNLGNNFWDLFIVPFDPIGFPDIKCVQQWSRLYDHLKDTELIYNDIEGCKLNYPKIWVIFSKFILNENYIKIYLLICFIFYNLIFYYFIKKYKSFFFIYFYFSGASLLLLVSGNIEILIFILLFLSLLLKNNIKLFFLYISVILKIFPIFSFISLIKSRNIKVLFYSIIFFSYIFFVFI